MPHGDAWRMCEFVSRQFVAEPIPVKSMKLFEETKNDINGALPATVGSHPTVLFSNCRSTMGSEK